MNNFLKKYTFYLLTSPILIIGLLLAWIFTGKTFRGIDDANIYFIYMRNISEGFGFVYQQGAENVEGFTSLSWTLLGSLLYKINSNIHVLLIIINLVIYFYLFKIIYQFLYYEYAEKYKQYYLFCILLLLNSSGFITWNVFSLLETGLWTFTITFLTINTLLPNNSRRYLTFNIFLILLVFTRPESLLLGFLFLIGKTFSYYNEYKKINTKQIILSLCVLSVSIITLYSWRYINFNVLFPNTYYAKVAGGLFEKVENGISYDILFIKENLIWLLLILFSLLFFIIVLIRKGTIPKKQFNFLFLLSVLLISFAIPLLVGGDHFGLYRFFQAYIPSFILLFIYLIDASFQKSYIQKIVLIILLVLSIISTKYGLIKTFYSKENLPSKIEWKIVKTNKQQAILLNDFFKDASSYPKLGVLAAGAMSYYYNGQSVDLLGLNNVEMAHAPKNLHGPKNHSSFNKKVFYKQAPDLLISNIDIAPNTTNNDYIKIGEWEGKLLDSVQKDSIFNTYYGNYIITNNNGIVLKAYLKKEYVNRELINNPKFSVKQQ